MRKFNSFFVGLGTWTGDWILLLARLFWGGQFVLAGWSKLQDPAGTASFFHSLNIPFAEFNAHLVGYVEFIGGIALVLGLFSRLFAVPLIITMLVALFTDPKASLQEPMGIVRLNPFNFLMASLFIFAFGAGKYSLDALLCKKSKD